MFTDKKIEKFLEAQKNRSLLEYLQRPKYELDMGWSESIRKWMLVFCG